MTSRSKQDIRDYMREYMRERRLRERLAGRKHNAPAGLARRSAVRRDEPLYDPTRDGPLHHASLTAVVMGDPPIGRRAIDQDQARKGISSISLAGARP